MYGRIVYIDMFTIHIIVHIDAKIRYRSVVLIASSRMARCNVLDN